MKVAFFHGLESDHPSDKTHSLEKKFDEVLALPMDYKNPSLFDNTLNAVKAFKPDLLIGSSMGGWFAYCISTLTGIPTLLFNPAVHSRSIEPEVRLGKFKSEHTVVFGRADQVIDPSRSMNWFDKKGIGSFDFNYESNAHRTPINIFNKWVNSMKINEGELPSFQGFLLEMNEMEIPSGRWIDYDLKKVDDEGMREIWKMYIDSYSREGLDLSANDRKELQGKYKATFLKDVDKDKHPDAFIIYKPTPYGNKIALLGTNGLKDARRDIVKKLLELVNTKGWFIEASKKMEDLLSTSNVPVVKNEEAIKDIVGKDKEPEMLKDGYYERYLSKANKKIVKRIYGILK
jgi:hypothetical protein